MVVGLFLALMVSSGDSPPAAAPPAATSPVVASPPQSPAPTPPQTLQQRFEAASQAYAAGRCREAIGMLTDLEPHIARQRTALASVMSRRGVCMEQLGQTDDASAVLERALAMIDPAIDATRIDFVSVQMSLGRIAYRRFDYAAARDRFRIALAQATSPDEQSSAQFWLAHASLFSNQTEGMAAIDELLARNAALPESNRHEAALFKTIKARIMLNRGDYRAARELLRTAISQQGGLDLTVNVAELETRNDAGLAAALAGDREFVLLYISYTGAGSLDDGPFGRAAILSVPACDPAVGIAPEDRAVVEFAIAVDGSVAGAQTVWMSHPSDAAAAQFGLSVAGWTWRREDVANIPPILRSAVRVELRCSNGRSPIDYDSVGAAAAAEWLAAQHVPDYPAALSTPTEVAQAQVGLARRRVAGGGATLIPVLSALGRNPLVDYRAAIAYRAEAAALARAAGAPARVSISDEIAGLASANRRGRGWIADVQVIGTRTDVQADAVAKAIIAVAIAAATPSDRPDPAIRALVEAVVADDRLDRQHPLRIAALLKLADWQAAAGQVDAARVSYAATGLTQQQCALSGLQPILRRSGLDFPDDSLGFSGWARVEFDVDANGHTLNRRATIAYPPLIFAESAERGIRDSQYTRSFSPTGSQGCSAATQTIRYHSGL